MCNIQADVIPDIPAYPNKALCKQQRACIVSLIPFHEEKQKPGIGCQNS